MKMIHKTVLAVFFTAAALVSTNAAFAGQHMDKMNHMNGKDAKLMAVKMQENVATLREAAGALKVSNPRLSQKLSDMADVNNDMLKRHDVNGMMQDKVIVPDLNTTGNKATKLGTKADSINVNTP